MTPPGPVLDQNVTEEDLRQRRALAWAALAACAAMAWITAPLSVGILLGTLLAFTLQPLFERLEKPLGKEGAALTLTLGTAVMLVLLLTTLTRLLLVKGTVVVRELIAALSPGGSAGGVLTSIGRWTSGLGLPPEELIARARVAAQEVAGGVASTAEALVHGTASLLLGLFFAMMSIHYILRNWSALTRRAQQTLPLRPDYTAALFAEFRRVGRNTLLGTIVTGIAQGVLATIGYWMAGIHEPVFFGAVTALASLIPALGTLLVWVPAGVGLMLLGHSGRGILELLWGTVVVVGVSDYVIRPRLVGGEGNVPSLFTFIALLGGVEAFGLKGLIVGPVVMSLALAVLRLYAVEVRARRPPVSVGGTWPGGSMG